MEAIVDDEGCKIEYSPLSSRLTRDGVTVDVKIYRLAGTDDPWQLEVVDQNGSSTVWDDPFPTAQEAHQAFSEAIEDEGMASFVIAIPTMH